MPAAIQDRAVDADVSCLRRGEDFLRTGDTVIHHPRRVLADPVVNPRRRDAVDVLQHWVERDAQFQCELQRYRCRYRRYYESLF